jgi:hypothetical protein
MWRAGAASRALRPTDEARDMTSAKGVGGRKSN